MEASATVFSALRRKPFVAGDVGYSGPLQFMLAAGPSGWRLRAVDASGQTVMPDPRGYIGREADRVKAYRSAYEAQAPSFDWAYDGTGDLPSDQGVDLSRHSDLLKLFATTGCLIDAERKPITAVEGDLNSFFALELNDLQGPNSSEEAGRDSNQSRGIVHTSFGLKSEDGAEQTLEAPHFINEHWVLDRGTLYPVTSIGPAFAAAHLFCESVPVSQIDPFLSLFVSSFPEMPIEASGYSVNRGTVVAARPAIVFEEVDAAASLFLSVNDLLPNLELAFVRDYDVSRLGHIDFSAKVIRVSEVAYEAAHLARQDLLAKLRKLDRRTKTPGAFFEQDEDGHWILGADLAKAFLTEHLAELAGHFALLGAEKLKRYKITHVQPKLRLKLSSGIDFLEGEGTLDLNQEKISLIDALSQYRKHRYLTLSDGTQAMVNADYMEKLGRLFKKRKEGLRVSFFDLPLIDELIEANEADATFTRSREVFRGFNQLAERKLPLPRFKGKLRPYQKSGLQWMDYLYSHKLGGCLADDMGLGKTVQAIALLSRIYPKVKAPSLIVMPRSLLFNWSRELQSFAPQLNHCIHHGMGRDWEAAQRHQIVLTTYGTLRSDVETIAATHFHAVLLDESQAIKNLQTQTAQAALALKATFRLALSGTPVENHLGELYTLFRFLNPAMFGTAADFERDYAVPIQKQNDASAAHELRKKIYPFVLRRLKSDVLKDLPPKIEQVLYVEMGQKQKEHYEARRLFYKSLIDGEVRKNGIARSQFVILEAMLELRQIATVPESKTEGRITSAKQERLLDALEEALANNRKCLVFSNFLAGVEQVCETLNERGIGHLQMTGATADRERLVHRFQTDPKTKVFVMSLKTGGVGLNLTAADTVFILDPWWNTAAESQAVDRAHRIGQSNTVFTYRLIAKDSIEEKIRKLQEQKQQLVDQVVGADGTQLKSLSEGDIEDLFSA